jgi:hypothetical protein
MLEKVIDTIISKITKEVLTPQMNEISLNYLMNCKIPESVKHFFNQEVEIWLREESDKFTSNERFNYDSPEVRVLIDKIFDILKNTATLHVNKFNQLLERAIKLEANYLIRPHQTLTQFLFKNSPVVTTMEVYDMLKYFDKLQYYKDALTDYFNLKYLREISQNHFEELILGIDRQVFSKDKLNVTLKTIKAILNFFNEGREPSNSIPLDILIKAFEDRNLDDYKTLIESEIQKGNQELSLANLEVLLRTGQIEKIEAEAKAEQPEISVEEVADIETAKPEISVEEISVAAEATAPVQEIPEVEAEEEEEEEEEEVEPAVSAPQVEEYVPQEEAPEEPVQVTETEPAPAEGFTAADQLADVVSEKIKGKYLEDLNNIISQKNRKKFVKKIFKKDDHRYSKFIAYVNQLPTWKKATTAIEEMFYQTGINPYSSIAIEFSDLIYNRYFPKDKKINRQEYM